MRYSLKEAWFVFLSIATNAIQMPAVGASNCSAQSALFVILILPQFTAAAWTDSFTFII